MIVRNGTHSTPIKRHTPQDFREMIYFPAIVAVSRTWSVCRERSEEITLAACTAIRAAEMLHFRPSTR